MERYLKPEKLELDVKDSLLNEESFKHWLKRFENFLAAVIASDGNRNTDTNKLGLLTNHVFPLYSSIYGWFAPILYQSRP